MAQPKPPTYYDILEIPTTASKDDIQKAYKKGALKWHPDRHLTEKEEAETKFKQISKAYEVLKDDQKRAHYDMFGEDDAGGGGGNAAATAAAAADFLNPFNLFANIFRGNINMNNGNHSSSKDNTIIHDVKCSLADIYTGVRKKEMIHRTIFCATCANTGFADKQPHLCTTCNGQGVQMVAYQIAQNMFQQSTRTCPACKGSRTDCGGGGGTAIAACTDCKGQKKIKDTLHVEFDLKRGTTQTGLVLRGKGHQLSADTFGDICIQFKHESDPVYARKENNLHRTIEISLRKALLGFSHLTLDHIDGSTLTIASSGGVISPGSTKKIANLGFLDPATGICGDYILQFIVEFPQKISHKQHKALDIILRKDPDEEPDATATPTTIYQLEHVFSPPTQRFYEDISVP
jgi:DnaJ-class molecular chaperone